MLMTKYEYMGISLLGLSQQYASLVWYEMYAGVTIITQISTKR